MPVGSLEVYTGGMFAEKSTSLIRQGKRHLMAGRKVAFIKPFIDGRYGHDAVATHDGVKHYATTVSFDEFTGEVEDFTDIPRVAMSDVICIDEVQFFPKHMVTLIKKMVYTGKHVYVAGLDMDKNGIPFETVMLLMGIAEKVKKFHAVCRDCGGDAWVSVETEKKEGRVNIGNDYKPVCRSCSVNYLEGNTQ